jgi:hypothetical protein
MDLLLQLFREAKDAAPSLELGDLPSDHARDGLSRFG